MRVSKNVRVIFSLAAGGLLLVGLFLLLGSTYQIARADPGMLFVTSDGTGDCTQANPCALQMALLQATEGDTIFVKHGTYTATSSAVITITKSITLYGGWDGGTATALIVQPDIYTTTLDGENVRRVVHITGTVSPKVDGFTLRNGYVASGSGGAV